MTTKELLDRLRRHYIKPGQIPPGGIFLDECGLNGRVGGRVDAVHVGFTSTSGRILTGHELKVSRADWLHELNSPGKADQWADECHAWYLVTADADIVKPGELPAGWGHMVPGRSKTRMDVLVKPTIHPEREPSWPIVRSIMARLDTQMWGQINQIRGDAEHKARTDITAQVEKRVRESANYDLRQAQSLIADLEEELGCKISDYRLRSHRDGDVRVEHLGQALRLVQAREPLFGNHRGLPSLIERMSSALDELRTLAEADKPPASETGIAS